MGIYSHYIFPYLVDRILDKAEIAEYRKKLLSNIQGKILEVGFGTGLNLSNYPEDVRFLTAVDPNPGMKRKAERRIAKSSIQVSYHLLNGEKLPFENQAFDSVVSTFSLCSIKDVELALWEIHRVLKNRGRFYFLEHGLSPDSKVQYWQKKLTPIQKRLSDGCHLDREIASLIDSAGFKFIEIKEFYYSGFPKVGGFFYHGIAEKVGT